MGLYHDFSLTERRSGQPEIHDAPPVGALSAFSLELLAQMSRWVGVDDSGRLVLYVSERPAADRRRLIPVALTFEPVRFDPGNVLGGPPQMLVCRRVA